MRKHNSTYRKGIRRRTEGETTFLYYFSDPRFEGLGVRLEVFGGWENPQGFWGTHLGHWAWVR